jgi:lysine biosynthesis protein LysW
MAVTPCLDCGCMINLGPEPQKSQMAICPRCGSDFEIIELNPLDLDWISSKLEDDRDIDLRFFSRIFPLRIGT